jgi:ABC-2 type transport system permease protein
MNAVPNNAEARTISNSVVRVHPFYWSLRRELWEARHILFVIPIVGVVATIGLVASMGILSDDMRHLLKLDAGARRQILSIPYAVSTYLLSFVLTLAGCIYCLSTMHTELRDRTVLFWKSLPVSNKTTVLAKVSLPLFVFPVVVFFTHLCVQIVIAGVSVVVALRNGLEVQSFLSILPYGDMAKVLVYRLATTALWQAPMYCWLLMTSSVASRTWFLWGVVLPLVIAVVEKMMLKTSFLMDAIWSRFDGSIEMAFSAKSEGATAVHQISRAVGSISDTNLRYAEAVLDPAKFFSSAQLWVGLALASLFLVATTALRRRQQPI